MNVRRLSVAVHVFAITVLVVFIAPTSLLAEPTDPFAQPGAAPSSPFPSGGTSADTLIPQCEQITKAVCGKASNLFLGIASGYVVGCVLLFSILRVWWSRRGTSTAGVRFLVPLLLSAAVAGVLVALDPARGQDLKCCLADGVLKAEILLQDSNTARAVLLGVLPTATLYTLVALTGRMLRG